jgi:hypothetical protein
MMKEYLSTVPEAFKPLVANLLAINDSYAEELELQMLNPKKDLRKYIEDHPTKIMVFKCMDGRILFSAFTGTPKGFLRNFRNLGGQFNHGWARLRDIIFAIVKKAHVQGNGSIAIITYHYSKGSKTRGCAAYNFNEVEAMKGAFSFKKQIERAYKTLGYHFVPIVVGIETDEDALILHNDHGDMLNLADVPKNISKRAIHEHIRQLYPHMTMQMRMDLLPLIMGNIKHVAELRKTERSIIALDHNEWIIGVGGATAFDFLHIPNTAILVGQYNPNLERPIKKAFEVYKQHWQPGKKFLQLTAASYGDEVPRSFAYDDVKYYSRLAREVATEHFSSLLPDMFQVRGLLNLTSQKLEILPFKGEK